MACIAWLTVCVWAQVVVFTFWLVCMLFFIDGQHLRRSARIGWIFSAAFSCLWSYLWNYLGYWAIQTQNAIWTIIFVVCEGCWLFSLLGNIFYAFDWMAVSMMFLFAGISYIVLTISAAHVVIFGAIAWHKGGGVERAQQQGQAAMESARDRGGGSSSESE
jgi:hypothetical protein